MPYRPLAEPRPAFGLRFILRRSPFIDRKYLRPRVAVGRVLSCRDLTIGKTTERPVLVDLYLRLRVTRPDSHGEHGAALWPGLGPAALGQH